MTNENERLVQRQVSTRRFLDRQRNPPEYVDEELPTTTVQLGGASNVGRARAPRGTAVGSLRLTGSYQPLAPGTYSLRVTRLSVFAGSREVTWYLRHSRTGTADIIYFPAPGQETRLGGPKNPVYAFGPGTLTYGFLEAGSAYWMGAHMEGVAG